ncbi:hypothetical protein RHGRI_001431 [Rhododendron griersonianum]|uniref:Uncharacterized protein n=1 Tax=Rhododendron griersonianum TaxID=479676 RepID=A0AAV6LK65_9ERIC|nr:hypothetical protein RHGRI_001431 [Rhododendron griersonianum]
MHCSWHSKTRGVQGKASRLLVIRQGNAMLTACQDRRWPRQTSRHAKTKGGQGMKSPLLFNGHGDALLTAFQNKGCSRQGKPITCHRAKQCIAHGMTRPRWPRHDLRQAKTRGGQVMKSRLLVTGQGDAFLTAYQFQGWPMHDSRRAKTRGGQGLAIQLLFIGQGNALLTACQDQVWPRLDSRHDKTIVGQGLFSRFVITGPGNALLTTGQDQGWTRHDSRQAKTKGWTRQGKQIAFHRARKCIAHGMPSSKMANAKLTTC